MTIIWQNKTKTVFIKKRTFNKNNGRKGQGVSQPSQYELKFRYEGQGFLKKFWNNFPFERLNIKKDDYENKVFKASSVITLKELLKNQKTLTYIQTLTLIKNIGTFFKHLETFNLGFLKINIDDVVVIDGYFFFFEENSIVELVNKKITINSPTTLKNMQKDKFVSPEIQKLDTIGVSVSSKFFYYNLASMSIYCLFNKYISNQKDSQKILEPIMETKLFWTLKRCLKLHPQDRFFLII